MATSKTPNKPTMLVEPDGQPVRLELDKYYPYLLSSSASLISQGSRTVEVDGMLFGMREWRILSCIADQREIFAKQISLDSGMDQGAISRAIKLLVKHGLVAQFHSGENKRQKTLCLTTRGVEVYETIARSKAERAEQMWSDLSDEERKELLRLLTKLKANILRTLQETGALEI